MGTLVEVRVPDIGDFKDVPVIELLVAPGQAVAANAPLLVLESDKATLEVPAPLAGVVRELRVKAGDRLSQGALVLLLEPVPLPVSLGPAQPPSSAFVTAVEVPAAARAPQTDRRGILPRASPSVRQFARQLGVDLFGVRGSGPGSRVTREDVQAYIKEQLQQSSRVVATAPAGSSGLQLLPWPQVDHAKFGPIERRSLSRIQKISGAHLARNWVLIPHVTNFDEAEVTALEEFRAQVNREQDPSGPKLTMLSFLIKACVKLLQKHPEFNSSLDGEELVIKSYYHVGFAVDTSSGLMVPVLRDADKKGLVEIARESAALATLARSGKLKPGDFQGGCFSISSLGGIGGTHFTPIINAPEVAILGVGRIQERLARAGTDIVTRQVLPLSLSWDHRVSDGASAARLLAELSRTLSDFRRALL